MPFDDKKYTEDALIKQLSLVELHSKDGSALDAGCGCIEGKHLFIIEGLSEEGKGFATSEQEKRFYEEVGNYARNYRKRIENAEWDSKGGDHKICVECDNLRGQERKDCMRVCKHEH
jgi:hypothetical protein